MKKQIGAIVALAGALRVSEAQEGRPMPFDARWQLTGEATRVEPLDGREALRMRSGSARLDGMRFKDGTIDLDVMLSPHRSFVYVLFRTAAPGFQEEVYLRTAKSELPDALQYSPVWNAESSWQLYHGKGATAAATLAHESWMHLRLVVQDRRAALFLGEDMTRPAIVMELAREPQEGGIGLLSFVPKGVLPADVPFTSFANVVVRPGYVPFDFSREPRSVPKHPPGLVTRWQLSAPFATPKEELPALPASTLEERRLWPAYDVEERGMLVVGRHLKRPAPDAAVVARLVVQAERDTLVPMELGFSDIATVHMNGRPIFRGNARYSYDEPRQEGVIGLHQSTAWLPLTKGENEVLILLSDDFGGWGLIGRLPPGHGASVVPGAGG
jgi:hypothetical protein